MSALEGSIPLLPSDGADDERFVDTELVAAGWQPRFVADPARRTESEELYTSLGLEVLAVAVSSGNPGSVCSACYGAPSSPHVMLYTRRSSAAPAGQKGRPDETGVAP